MNIGKKTDKPVIVFDLDDTLINLKEQLWKTIYQEYGKYRNIPHWSEWESSNAELSVGCTHEEIKRLANKDKIWNVTQPYFFSKFILRDLRCLGYYIVILTARNNFVPDAFNVTKKYLEKYELEYDELIISDAGANKMPFIKHHSEILLAIDDNITNCQDFKASGKIEHVVLHALPSNRNCNEFTRINSLYQIFPILGISY